MESETHESYVLMYAKGCEIMLYYDDEIFVLALSHHNVCHKSLCNLLIMTTAKYTHIPSTV